MPSASCNRGSASSVTSWDADELRGPELRGAHERRRADRHLPFFNDTAPPETYPLPLHDALPISSPSQPPITPRASSTPVRSSPENTCTLTLRSEEHTSELQSHDNLVCRLLL